MNFEITIGVGTKVGDQYRISLFGLRIPIKKFQTKDIHNGVWMSWGFTHHDRSIHFNWGKKYKIIALPWETGRCVYHKVLCREGKWIKDLGRDYTQKSMPFIDYRHTEKHQYNYRLKSGEVQHRIATVYVEKRIWWWKVFRFLPFFLNPIVPFKLTRKTIAVNFSDEVGEGSGSWKGGTTCCGYTMKKKETMYQCLRIMEIEREF